MFFLLEKDELEFKKAKRIKKFSFIFANRNIIILLKIENKSYKEASEILDISIKLAESLFSRAKKS